MAHSLIARADVAWLGPGRFAKDVQVECRGGTIDAVGDRRPSPGEVLEVGFLMPAGCDRHVHIELADPGSVLLRGVTAVRDLAWPADRIFALAAASELASFNGPLIRAAGPMLTGPGGYPTRDGWAPSGTGLEVGSVEQASAAVRDLVDRGADVIKVSLNAEAGATPSDQALAAICASAHGLGVTVTAHAQGAGQVERALGAGVDELAHTPWTHLLSDQVVSAAARSLRIVSSLDIHLRAPDPSAMRTALDNLRRFHAAGGRVVYGTDLGNGPIPPGIDTRELQLLAEAGLEYEEILECLTRAPLQAGAPADLLGLAESPLDDLRALDDLQLVVRAGRVVLDLTTA